ncbi:MAG: hypothetical protein H0W23_03750 [Chloroflexia bacterium]|nr:hypothetical protein [Chloroflexia bacterium]
MVIGQIRGLPGTGSGVTMYLRSSVICSLTATRVIPAGATGDAATGVAARVTVSGTSVMISSEVSA